MNRLLSDLRFGWRLLRKQPLIATATIFTLALGIGVNTAISSVVNAILVEPWPYQDPSELIALRGSFENQRTTWVAYREFQAWMERSRAFETIAAHRQVRNRLEVDGRLVGVIGVEASSNLFEMLGTEPLLGRTFSLEEDQPGAAGVAVLSFPFWQRRFGGRDSVLGETVRIEGEAFEIIGVMKPGMLYPGDFRDTAFWLPIGRNAGEAWGWSFETPGGISVTGRLEDGVDLTTARSDMDRIAAELATERPETHQGRGIFMQPILERSFGQLRPRVLALAAAAVLVLMIACVNVAGLLLVRGADRSHELAVRRALGASRWAISRQLLVESVSLSLAGATAGLAVAWLTLKGLLVVADVDTMPAFRELAIDGRILSFTAIVAVVVGVIFGIAPALAQVKAADSEALHGDVKSSSNRRGGRLRETLVVAEIALALVLSICAVLSVRSFYRMVHDHPGFDPTNLLTFAFSLPEEGFSQEQQAAFFDRMLERLESLPGIEKATTTVPIAAYWSASFEIVGRPQDENKLSAKVFKVSPGFFATLGVQLVRGRAFEPGDRAGASPVLVVDQLFADTFWSGDADVVGQRIRLATDPRDRPGREIVGIVERAGYEGPHLAAKPTFYQPAPQAQQGWGWAVMRTTVEPEGLAEMVHREMAAVEAELLVDELWTMEHRLGMRRSAQRLAQALLSSFAAIALVLAAVGVYGVIAYSVAARRREIGIRLALGAGRADIVRLIQRHGFRLAAAGVAVGLILSLGGVRLLTSQLYGIGPYSLTTWLALVLAVVAGVLAACALPAWRASHIRPATALRGE